MSAEEHTLILATPAVKDFYGPGMTVDTTKKFTVVTQFIKGSDGVLNEIKRFYVQDGKVIPNSESTIPGTSGNSVNPEFCKAQKVAFGDGDHFNEKGGFAQFSKAVAAPMVLVMSLWDDHYANMLWLDSTYPTDASPDEPGKGRGTCDTGSGVPADIETSQASNSVIYCTLAPCFDKIVVWETLFTNSSPPSNSEHQVRPHRLDLRATLNDAGVARPLQRVSTLLQLHDVWAPHPAKLIDLRGKQVMKPTWVSIRQERESGVFLSLHHASARRSFCRPFFSFRSYWKSQF